MNKIKCKFESLPFTPLFMSRRLVHDPVCTVSLSLINTRPRPRPNSMKEFLFQLGHQMNRFGHFRAIFDMVCQLTQVNAIVLIKCSLNVRKK